MRTISTLRRLLRLLRSATKEAALLGGIIEIPERIIGDGPTIPPVTPFDVPMFVSVSASRNYVPVNIDAIDLSAIPDQSREAVQMVLERDAPNIVEDARRSLKDQVINWTGKLSSSIQWFPEPMGISVHASAYYADWVEEGHQSFMGYHYMQYATDMARMRLPEKIRAELNKVINKGD